MNKDGLRVSPEAFRSTKPKIIKYASFPSSAKPSLLWDTNDDNAVLQVICIFQKNFCLFGYENG